MKRLFKKGIVFILVVVLAFTNAVIVFADNAEEPVRVPVRSFFEEAGADVEWDDESRSITITLENNEYILHANSQVAYRNAEAVDLQFAIIIQQNLARIAASDLAVLLGVEQSYLGITIESAMQMAVQNMELFSVTGLTMAIVDAEHGFTWTGGFGFADVSAGVPVDEYTLFGLGSISKTFTAAAVMQLVEAGIIDLDEPVTTYLPDFSMPTDLILGVADYRNITPRMLLAHASGIHGDIVASGVATTGRANPGFMNNFLDTMTGFPMSAPESTVFSYANNSFTLLGVLVAAMTGDDSYYDGFVDYTRENIFEPAGMELTTFALEDRHKQYLALSYSDAETQDEFLYYNAVPAGGVFSNANDMARFMHTILNGGAFDSEYSRILSTDSVNQMLKPQDFGFDESPNFMAPNMRPGMGFLNSTGLDGFKYVGHSGNLIHYHSGMVYDLDTGLGVFVSTNSITGMALADALPTLILQTAIYEKTGDLDLPESDLTVLPIELDPEQLQELEGFYSIIGADRLANVFVDEDGALYLDNILQLPFPLELIPLSNGSFINLDTELYFWFEEFSGELLIYLGEFKSYMMGAKFDSDLILAITPDEDFQQWTGTYYPVTDEGDVCLFSHLVVGIDENGFSYAQLFALHGMTPYSVLIPIEDNVYYGGIVFVTQGDDIWVEFSGARLLRAEG